MSVYGLGQPENPVKPTQKSQINGLGWVIGWVWFLKLENP